MDESLKFIIVGHVDHGKSTLIGRLLYDTNSLSPDKVAEMQAASNGLGRETEFAYLLDHLEEERKQGITIDTTQVFFKTDSRRYVIIDAPGHVAFVKNMITGASQAEAALLIVDGTQGVQEQTKRHAYVLSFLGIKQVVVVINKMDLVEDAEEVFCRVEADTRGFLQTIGIEPKVCIPTSALNGDNVATFSHLFNWYTGPTVLECLDQLEHRQARVAEEFVMPVQDIYKIDDRRIVVGRVESGNLQPGAEVKILTTGEETTIDVIEAFPHELDDAEVGECIGLRTKDPSFVDRGDLICSSKSSLELTMKLHANLFWMTKNVYQLGQKLNIRVATQEVSCKIVEIKRVLNSSTMEVVGEHCDSISNLDVAEVVIKTKKPIAVAPFDELEGLGRFVLVSGEHVCAGGIVV